MKARDENTRMKVDKIYIKDFVATLMELHELGIEYVDLVITKDKGQDEIGIVVRQEHSKPKRLTDEELQELLK